MRAQKTYTHRSIILIRLDWIRFDRGLFLNGRRIIMERGIRRLACMRLWPCMHASRLFPSMQGMQLYLRVFSSQRGFIQLLARCRCVGRWFAASFPFCFFRFSPLFLFPVYSPPPSGAGAGPGGSLFGSSFVVLPCRRPEVCNIYRPPCSV